MKDFYIHTFAALHKTGMYSSSKGLIKWDNHQNGSPLEVERKQVYEKLHTGFGKLNAPDKLAFSTAALLFSDYSDYKEEKTGICLGTVYGSFCTDLHYIESVKNGFPSPGYFTATLPSSAATEVAIMFKLKGPDRIFVGSSDIPGFTALESALRIIEMGKAETMVFILINGLDTKYNDSPLLPLIKDTSSYSYGLIISNKKKTRGINFKISLEINNSNLSNNNSQKMPEEFYFFKLIQSLLEEKDFSSVFCFNKMNGLLNIKKDVYGTINK